MTSIFDPKPELIRVRTFRKGSCLFCDNTSSDAIIGENNEEFYLCRDHFKALCDKLKNFH